MHFSDSSVDYDTHAPKSHYPNFFQIFSYTRRTRSSIQAMRSSQLNQTNSSSSDPGFIYKNQSTDIFLVEKRLATRLFGLILVWILGWTPFAIIALAQLLGYGSQVSKYFSLMAMIFCKSSSVVNAYFYGMR